MARLICDLSMSLDGYVAGPNQTLEQPLGRGGERLHEWAFRLKSFRERHGMPGGESGPDDDIVKEWLDANGAVVMGRRMFSGGEGPWEDDPNADGWWGDDPPFHVSVFVLTHHPRDPVVKEGGTSFTFVTEGIEAALGQARAAAGGKDVQVGGGAELVQQYLNAGLLDELNIHLVPVLLGNGGVRLLDRLEPTELELTRVIGSDAITHLRYRRLA
ncbi:MAG: dihydrofolate reductase [Actinobacteria bacterium]|nr:MAG: dihydrofolate reductase [Actinomycetota bacterium]